jgi:hypothetical protein
MGSPLPHHSTAIGLKTSNGQAVGARDMDMRCVSIPRYVFFLSFFIVLTCITSGLCITVTTTPPHHSMMTKTSQAPAMQQQAYMPLYTRTENRAQDKRWQGSRGLRCVSSPSYIFFGSFFLVLMCIQSPRHYHTTT